MADPVVFENGYVAASTATGSAAYVQIAGVRSAMLPISRAQLADDVMGDTIDAKYPGILSIPVSIECRQDFTTAAAGVDKWVHTRFAARTAFRIKFRGVNAAVSSTNPTYILNRVAIFEETPIDGKHGDALTNKIKVFPMSGCTLARSTST